ncbi:MAG: hypothetical protein RSB71_02750 [Bacilli bacterium]
MNKKGFAVTGIIYSILILFLILVFSVLSILGSRKLVLDKLKNDVANKLNNEVEAPTIIYKDAILDGNDPVLDNGLIPVVYDVDKWVVADVSKAWYDYTSKQWANAIIVNANKKADYIAGTAVLEEDVLAYMVWVPRYEYHFDTNKIGTDKNKPGAIDIKFTKSSTATSGYIMHPAFTFDNKQLNGLWVGKFETTGTVEKPTIKPNNVSLTNQNVSTQFNTAQIFNTYGLTNADSHMMKNTEWGAVAYLTQSIYGRCVSETSCEEVTINNINTDMASSYAGSITGCAGDTVSAGMVRSATCPDTNKYQTLKGMKASTTGNITGIYDMSGGTYEYVMGNFNKTIGNSGFSGMPAAKYFDLYTISTSINGDATNAENTNGFYGDDANFTNVDKPWFMRGGNYAYFGIAGIFAFYNYTGEGYGNFGFRITFTNLTLK